MDSIKKERIKSAAILIAFLALMVILSVTVGRPLIKFVSDPDAFRTYIEGSGFLGKLAFVGMMALQVVVAIIPGEPLEIGAGYAFGPWQGLLLCLIGVAAGTAVIYLLVKYGGRKVIEAFFPVDKIESMRFLRDEKRLNVIVFILFFIPGTPKDLLTYCVWLTKIKFTTYLLISSIARIPSIISSTWGGDALANQNYDRVVWIFVITAVLSLAGIFIYNRIVAKKNRSDA